MTTRVSFDAPQRETVELGNGRFFTREWTKLALYQYRREALGWSAAEAARGRRGDTVMDAPRVEVIPVDDLGSEHGDR
jgi:hypothetical protein